MLSSRCKQKCFCAFLLAATTEHFGSIGKSLGRLFTQPAALTN